VTNDTLGTLSFDVTPDAAAILTGSPDHGWLLRKDEENRTGRLTFRSKESGTPATLTVRYRVE
jgi:hypothetical protein